MHALSIAKGVREVFTNFGWCVGVQATAVTLVKEDSELVTRAFQCSPGSPHAVSFCVTGAAQRVCPKDRDARAKFYKELVFEIGEKAHGGLPRWNDMIVQSKDDILSVLETLITRLEATRPNQLQVIDSRRH